MKYSRKCILLVLLFIFGCGKNDKIKNSQNNEENVAIDNQKYTDDEKLIFDIILEKGNKNRWVSDEEDEILFLVERNYILFDNSWNETIGNFLKSQNVGDESIKYLINDNKNREKIEIPLPQKYQFRDDFTDKKLIETTLSDSQRKKYILIEISNICFDKEMKNAIVYFSICFGTFSFVSSDCYYILFQKNNNKWEQTGNTAIWSGIS
jgi:outer membrane lipoprotein-sorting protein